MSTHLVAESWGLSQHFLHFFFFFPFRFTRKSCWGWLWVRCEVDFSCLFVGLYVKKVGKGEGYTTHSVLRTEKIYSLIKIRSLWCINIIFFFFYSFPSTGNRTKFIKIKYMRLRLVEIIGPSLYILFTEPTSTYKFFFSISLVNEKQKVNE